MAEATATDRVRPRPSMGRSGAAQFAGQATGLLLALVVSHLIARRLGVGPEADAFLLGRRLITAVTEALNQVVVVVFIPLIAAQAAAGMGVWGTILRSGGGALLAGTGLAAVFYIGAPAIVAGIAPDFAPDTAALATRVVAILSLALPATVATVAMAAYCNVRGRFGAAATIRQLPRAAVALALLFGTGALAVLAAASYTLAAFAVTALTLLMALRLSRSPLPHDAGPPSAGATPRRGAAAIVLTGGAMIVLWLETAVAAASGSGSVAMLDYAQRLGALLGNTMAMALTLVVFADMARRAAVGEIAPLGPRFHQATWTAISLMLPVTVGLIANAPAIIDLVLDYGAFSDSGTRESVIELTRWMAVAPLSALVVRMMYVRVLSQNDLPIVRVIGAAMAADIAIRSLLFWVLVPAVGLVGIPATLIVAPAAPIVVMVLMLRGRGVFTGAGAAAKATPVFGAAVATSGAIAAGAVLAPWLLGSGSDGARAGDLTGLLVSGAAGLLVIAISVVVFRIRPKLK